MKRFLGKLASWKRRSSRNWQLFKRNKFGMMGLGIIVFFGIMALLAFILPRINPIYDPFVGIDPELGINPDTASRSHPPSLRHPLGTDWLGRDVLSQLMHGAQIAFMIAIPAALAVVLIGTTVGLVSGYYGGVLDSFLMRLGDTFLILPLLPIFLLLSAIVGRLPFWGIIILVAAFTWVPTARIVRSVTLSLKERPFIESAKIAGASDFHIIYRHLAPNVLQFISLSIAFSVGFAILMEAGLSFLGLGDPTVSSWGGMLGIAFATGHTFVAPWWIIPPGLAITLLIMAFYLVSRAMDEIVNPRLREVKI